MSGDAQPPKEVELKTRPTWDTDHFYDTRAAIAEVLPIECPEDAAVELVYCPAVGPFRPSAKGKTTEVPISIKSVWDIMPGCLRATRVLYLPWQVELFNALSAMSPTLQIRVHGAPVLDPSAGIIVAAINKLRLSGSVELERAAVFEDVEQSSTVTSAVDFFEHDALLSSLYISGGVSQAERRFKKIMSSFEENNYFKANSYLHSRFSDIDAYSLSTVRFLFALRLAALHSIGFTLNEADADDWFGGNIVYIASDCVFLDVYNDYNKDTADAADSLVLTRFRDVGFYILNLDREVIKVLTVMREIDYSLLRTKFICGDVGVPMFGLCVRPQPDDFTHVADDVFAGVVPSEGAGVSVLRYAHCDSDLDSDVSDSDDEIDLDAVDNATVTASVQLLSAPRVQPQCRGARSLSVYTSSPIDLCLDEFVDLNRLQDAIRWRSLTRHDAKILELFAKQDGRHCVNYAPPEEGDHPSKKVKKETPTGLRHLTPGVRQFVLQAGTLCIDAKDWASLLPLVSLGRALVCARVRVCASVATFWERGSEVGLLPSGVKLVSLVPEGFLVRGFMDGPPSEELLATCRSIVQHDTGFDIGPLTIVNTEPLAGTDHPLAGDFRLWDEADISPFAEPLFCAMRKIIENRPHPRAFNWFYETEGNLGKTVHAKYYAQRGACCVSAQTPANIFFAIKDHVQKSGTLRLLIVDIPRDMTGINESFAGAIESIKDGLVFSGKYESGTIKLPSPTIILFANAPMPDSFKYALSPDRWRQVNLRVTPVHSESSRFVLTARDYPGVYTDSANYAVAEDIAPTRMLTLGSNGRFLV